MNKRIVITTIKVILLTAVAMVSYNYIIQHINEFKKIFQLKWHDFIILSLILLFELCIFGWLFKILIRYFNIELRLREWFGLTVLNRYFNYLFIKLGPVARGVYFKKIYNLPYINFITIFSFLYIIQMFWMVLLSILSMIVLYYKFHIFSVYFFIFLVLVEVITILPFFISKNVLIFLTKKSQYLSLIINQWLEIRKRKDLIVKTIFFLTIFILLSSFRIFLIYSMLFEPIPFPFVIIVTTVGFLSLIVSLTPASLGIKEFLMSYAAKLMGENFVTTAVVVSLDRIIVVIWVFIFGFMFSIWYLKKMNSIKTLR